MTNYPPNMRFRFITDQPPVCEWCESSPPVDGGKYCDTCAPIVLEDALNKLEWAMARAVKAAAFFNQPAPCPIMEFHKQAAKTIWRTP